MTKEDLKKDNPELYDEIVKEAKEKAEKEAKAKAKAKKNEADDEDDEDKDEDEVEAKKKAKASKKDPDEDEDDDEKDEDEDEDETPKSKKAKRAKAQANLIAKGVEQALKSLGLSSLEGSQPRSTAIATARQSFNDATAKTAMDDLRKEVEAIKTGKVK